MKKCVKLQRLTYAFQIEVAYRNKQVKNVRSKTKNVKYLAESINVIVYQRRLLTVI